jgi:ABC-2 type transport system ATP-binding protein
MRRKAVAVDGISFGIRRDEIFGLLGPNGSGKSTTIKMILGLLHRSKGRLTVFGKDPSDVDVKRRIGYLPEESYLYRFLTPTETLDFYGRLFGLAHAVRRRRTEELLAMVGLTHVAHRQVGEFSKGMARRLGIAQALINDPDLLILDEPTSGLDPLGSRQVKDLLLELGRRGKTILLSSHQLDDVQDVCDRMVILYGGRIRAAGTSDELLADTQHTLIKTPRLGDSALKAVEQALHTAQGVGIESVEAPRQTLEALFLDIVEKARAEQLATSGAQSGGRIAAFLQGEDAQPSGAGMIDDLVRASSAAPAQTASRASSDARAAAAKPEGADAAVLGSLIEPEQRAATPVRPTSAQQAQQRSEAAAKPDQGLIDSLLDDDNKPGSGGRQG